ncbi:hypothetical protein CLAFUR4_07517, partial [Fulvia fulva]
MTPITKFLALAALAAGAVAVADSDSPPSSIPITLPDDSLVYASTLYASPLVARRDKVSCSRGHSWDENTGVELNHFVADFAATYDGSSLARGAESSEWYTASNGGKFYLSVVNRACDNVKIESATHTLSLAVHACEIEGSGKYSGGMVDYGMTEETATGCGYYVITYTSVDTTSRLGRPAKRGSNCPTCAPFCLEPFSTCNPPEWSRCSQHEKDCILGQASSFSGCLMAGNCARGADTTSKLVNPAKRSDTCATCAPFCLEPYSTCNPPEWSRCSQNEKNCILGQASSFSGCLMAGNCA